MTGELNDGERRVHAITTSGLSIYDDIPVGNEELWIPQFELEALLNARLAGIPLAGLPLRTRSKVVKEHVCRALGYPVPGTFRRTQPRFPGQRFDVYVQKSANLQIWNEELEAARRYVIVRVAADETIAQVKVVTGSDLASLDTTGTLTQKYQARLHRSDARTELVAEDTDGLSRLVASDSKAVDLSLRQPTSNPRAGELFPIHYVFDRLRTLIGVRFDDPGRSQERNRGAMLHRLVCDCLGYASYQDDGQFPDVRHQLLEVKLQTSPTIDLGLVDPHSDDLLDIPQIDGTAVRHCDVRYAVLVGTTDGTQVALTRLFVTTGEMFFVRFVQFQGNIINRKIQIPLPPTLFEAPSVASAAKAERGPDH